MLILQYIENIFCNYIKHRNRMSQRIQNIIEDITAQYLENDGNIPWIIGFSGGKDSTVVLT